MKVDWKMYVGSSSPSDQTRTKTSEPPPNIEEKVKTPEKEKPFQRRTIGCVCESELSGRCWILAGRRLLSFKPTDGEAGEPSKV